MHSLERSLQTGLILSLVILLFVTWWVLNLSSRLLVEHAVYARLQHHAQTITALLSRDSSALPVATTDHELISFGRPGSGDYFMVRRISEDAESQRAPVVSPSVTQAALFPPVPEMAAGAYQRDSLVLADGQRLLAWYAGVRISAQPMNLGVYSDVTTLMIRHRTFQWLSAILAALILCTLVIVQRVVVRRSLLRLEEIRRDMLRLEQGQKIALSEDVPAEVMPLVTEFNQLLHRFEQRLRQSRNALGNLAHALKGPLNVLLRVSEVQRLDEKQRLAIVENAEHIRLLIESELKRARLAGRGSAGRRFDIEAELPSMTGLLQQVYSEKSVEVLYDIDDRIELVHDRQDMLELVGNLLDNAMKWCHSSVAITLREALHKADMIELCVEDDGPGCSPELLGVLTGRGVRVDESVAGHGLGLSIVQDIVNTYDGQLVLQRSERLGGMAAIVKLPLKAPSAGTGQ